MDSPNKILILYKTHLPAYIRIVFINDQKRTSKLITRGS